MPIPEDKIEGIKKKIIEQINSWNKPENQKQQAIQQIKQMNSKQLEEFLKKNNAIQEQEKGQSQGQGQPQQCPFCSLSKNKNQTFRIGENNDAVAILEIRPMSKGHTIIIPKQHLPLEKVPLGTFKLAKKIVALLKQKLNPKEVQLSTGRKEDHAILNIIPITGEESGERKEKSKEELERIQKEILSKTDNKTQNNGKMAKNIDKTGKNQESKKEPQGPEVVEEPRRVP